MHFPDIGNQMRERLWVELRDLQVSVASKNLAQYTLVVALEGNIIDKTILTVLVPVGVENCGVRNLNIALNVWFL